MVDRCSIQIQAVCSVAGYAAEVRQRLPGVLPEPERSPEWYQINPHRPERDGPEPEA